MKTKWQELHDALFIIAQKQVGSDNVYDYRQLSDGINYPFVDFDDSSWTATATKVMGAIKEFSFILNVWAELDDLKNLSNNAENIVSQASKIAGFKLKTNQSGIHYMVDQTVNPALRRAEITLYFK